MEYAKLRTLKLTNFMSIADAEIPIGAITNICGYNDQGKSAIRTALSVVMYDSDSNDQVKYIKDGTEFFEITCVFEDGVTISKIKHLNGASIWKMLKDTQLVYTNVNGDKILAVEDVPEPIAQYWGVYSDEATGQLLNVRTDRDPHFLTDNSGGENYKILSPLLHSEVLSKASAELIKDSNICKNEIDDQTTRYNMYAELLEQKVAPTEAMLDELQRKINDVVTKKTKQELLEQLISENKVAKSTDIAPELHFVDINKMQAIEQIKEISAVTQEKVYETITTVDINKLNMLEMLVQASKASAETETTPIINTVDVKKAELLGMLKEVNDTVKSMQDEVTLLESEIGKTETELCTAKQAMTDAGYRICKNCGSLVD